MVVDDRGYTFVQLLRASYRDEVPNPLRAPMPNFAHAFSQVLQIIERIAPTVTVGSLLRMHKITQTAAHPVHTAGRSTIAYNSATFVS